MTKNLPNQTSDRYRVVTTVECQRADRGSETTWWRRWSE